MKPILLILTLLLTSFSLQAQTDFPAMKQQFLDYRKVNNQDSALYIARKMNQLALKEQSDTSYWYALSMRYQGNPHYSWGNTDSTIYYWQKSVELFKKYHSESPEYTRCLNNLGGLYRKMGDYKSAEPLYKECIKIRKKVLGKDHSSYATALNNLGLLYSKMGNYRSAEPLYKECLEIYKKVLGKDHSSYATALNNLGMLYSKMGDYNSAEPLYKECLEIKKKVVGNKHKDYVTALNNLGGLYIKMGDYKSAEPLYKEYLDIKKKVVGNKHKDYATALNSLGMLYSKMGDYNSAEPLYKECIKIRKKVLGKDHSSYATALNNLGLLYSKMGDYRSAEPLYKECLEIYKKVLGKDHSSYATALNNLGMLYSKMGDYNSAEPLYKECIKIRKKVLGKDHSSYAIALNNLGGLYRKMGDYKSAEPLYKEYLDIKKKVVGNKHKDYATALNSLGLLYSKMGDYRSAEPLYKEYLDIKKKVVGDKHKDYAMGLNNLGWLYLRTENYTSAEICFNESKEIRKNVLGEHHPDYATILSSLGTLYSKMGDYRLAELNLKGCLVIRERIFGKEHNVYLTSLNNLGFLYCKTGDYESAELLLMQCMNVRKNTLGVDNPSYATNLNNLGWLYSQMGNYESAELFYKECSDIRKRLLGDRSAEYARSLNNLGFLYSKMGEYRLSESLYKECLKIKQKALGKRHSDYATSLNGMALLYSQMGNYQIAKRYFKQGLNIRKKVLSEKHQDYCRILIGLGSLHSFLGDYKSAKFYLSKSLKIKLDHLRSNFAWLSGREKEAYWARENEFYAHLNTFTSKAAVEFSSSTEISYNGNLVSKSLLLETSRELDQALASSSDTTLKENYQNLKSLRKNYSKLVSEGSDNKALMERLNREADSLDKILVNSLGEYAASKRKFEITWKDVQSNLNSTEAAIEFAKYYDDKDSVYKYMALVVRPDYEYPKLALLGEEEQIREYIESRTFEALYPMVWEPIEKHLSGVNRIYYSPAGQLNNLSFSALCMGDRKELSQKDKDSIIARGEILTESTSSFECEYLMDRYELHQLTTTRYIADGTLDKQIKMNTSIALGGGINYDTVPKAHSENKEEDNTEYIFAMNLEQEKERENTKRSSKNTSKMSYLEGTKKEVDQVAALFQNKNWSLSAYTDTKAEEGKFKEEVEKNKAGIIHIATHGFAFPDVKKNKRQQQLIGNEEISYRASEDPMVRCGLMFSGSNVSWTGNPQKMIKQTGEDGILTAAEVSNMDLSNTKLVVLSACETGLGKIEGSEGTYGLKRGFKLAGVEQMIVSLWSVPDKETMELMTLFYEDLTQSLNPVKSFEKAQKQMRESYPTRPDLWAGFVLVR